MKTPFSPTAAALAFHYISIMQEAHSAPASDENSVFPLAAALAFHYISIM